MTATISVTVHASQHGLRIGMLYPDNNGQVTLEDHDGLERVTMFLPESQWTKLFESLPLSHSFVVASSGNQMKGKQAHDFLQAVYGVTKMQDVKL